MATNNIIHGDYVRIKYGPHANKQGYVYEIEADSPHKWRRLTIDVDDNPLLNVQVYEPDVERIEIIRERFEVGDRVRIVEDLTGGFPNAVGRLATVLETDGSRKFTWIALPIKVEDTFGNKWDCNPEELELVTEAAFHRIMDQRENAPRLTLEQVGDIIFNRPATQVVMGSRPRDEWVDPSEGYYDRFEDIANELIATHNRKGADYGVTEDPYANVRSATDFGMPAWIGVAIRMQDKMRRIQAASRQWAENGEVALANESLEDAFLDLAVYGVIGMIMLKDDEEGTSP